MARLCSPPAGIVSEELALTRVTPSRPLVPGQSPSGMQHELELSHAHGTEAGDPPCTDYLCNVCILTYLSDVLSNALFSRRVTLSAARVPPDLMYLAHSVWSSGLSRYMAELQSR